MLTQVQKTSKLLNISTEATEEICREVLKHMYKTPWDKKPPEMARSIYRIINEKTGNSDPYKEVKSRYNNEILALSNDLRRIIKDSDDSFTTALKLAISGNLIDFGTNISISKEIIMDQIDSIEHSPLVINHSAKLKEKLSKSNDLLYLGDNCGEIVFDKFFIEHLKELYPNLTIRFGVRGAPIINDVTLFDAEETGLNRIVEIIDNGDDSPGTILNETSREFQDCFYGSDIVISKGQGNYESLHDVDRQNVYFLFMAKCEPVATSLGVEQMSLICIER